MTTPRTKKNANRRRHVGDAILASASVLDTSVVAKRLEAFTAAHHALGAALSTLDEAEKHVELIRTNLVTVGANIDTTLTQLFAALIVDRGPQRNPFALYDAPSVSAMIQMSATAKATATLALVTAVLNDATVSPQTHTVAKALQAAAEAVAPAAQPLGAAETALRQARLARDGAGRTWDQALLNLKRDVRIATDEGASNLYTLLFDADAPSAKKAKSAPDEAPPEGDAVEVAA